MDADELREWAKEAHTSEDSPEIKALRAEIKRLRRLVDKKTAATGLLVDAVKSAYRTPPDLKYPKPPKAASQGRGKKEIACLHISDTQIGKITSTYDTEIAGERIDLLVDRVLRITDIRRSGAKVDDLRIYLGGDMVEGEDIFGHQAHLIDSSVFDQAVKNTPAILARAVLRLAEHFKHIRVVCVSGNHGRNGPKGSRAHPKTNWDTVCYEVLKVMLVGTKDVPTSLAKRVEVCIPDSFYAVDYAFDWGNLMVHGHQIGGGGGGFPLAGTTKKLLGWQDSIPEPWDYLWFGHFHTYASGTHNERVWLCNGTTESSNTFAQGTMAATGHPCQRFAFFDADHGLVADHQVYLHDAGTRLPQRAKAEGWREDENT